MPSIYDAPDTATLMPIDQLERILKDRLVGLELGGYPIRTRSKVVKTAICEAIGYPVPASFRKTHPRFPAQDFDVYTQKSLNVQIWNEEIVPTRRYAFVRTNENSVVTTVRVITGEELARFDTTGKLTSKYQATMRHFGASRLFSPADTPNVADWVAPCSSPCIPELPTALPGKGRILPIAEIYSRLLPLVGATIDYIDAHQERNRGSVLHSHICAQLGYSSFADDGQYPDIVHQLIEVKLQTSPTIDLGKHSPQDGEAVLCASGKTFRSEDIRYVVFDASLESGKIVLDNLYVVNGAHFAEAFPLFQGKVQNKKLQIPLPPGFFD